jgi:hypothetical protein
MVEAAGIEETLTGCAKTFARHELPSYPVHGPRKLDPAVSCLVPLRTAPTDRFMANPVPAFLP